MLWRQVQAVAREALAAALAPLLLPPPAPPPAPVQHLGRRLQCGLTMTTRS